MVTAVVHAGAVKQSVPNGNGPGKFLSTGRPCACPEWATTRVAPRVRKSWVGMDAGVPLPRGKRTLAYVTESINESATPSARH